MIISLELNKIIERLLLLTILICSSPSLAGISLPSIGGGPPALPPSTIVKDFPTLEMDGYQEDWFDLSDEGVWSSELTDLGIHFSTKLSERVTLLGSTRLTTKRRYYFLKVKKSEEFSIKGAQIITSYKNNNGQYRTINGDRKLRVIHLFKEQVAYCPDSHNVNNGNVWRSIEDNGRLKDMECKSPFSGNEREGAVREDDEYIYFEFHTVEPYYPNDSNRYPIPVVTMIASNEVSQIQPRTAICSPNCPQPEDWYGESKGSVQIGISVQIPLVSGQVSFVSDLSTGIYPSSSVGPAPRNRDVEVEGFIVFYNTDDVNAIVNGASYTYTQDFGRLYGFGVVNVVNSELNIYGVGVTAGLIGIPDADIALSYGFEPNPNASATINGATTTNANLNNDRDRDRDTGNFGDNDGAGPHDDSWSHDDDYNDNWNHDADHETYP